MPNFDDDFFIDDNELAEDNQMSIVDDAIMKCLDAMEKTIIETKNNLKFNEQSDARHNLKILAMHFDSAIKLAGINTEELSDEEIFEEIEKVLKQTTELTFSNMNDVLPVNEEENIIAESNADDSDFDF